MISSNCWVRKNLKLILDMAGELAESSRAKFWNKRALHRVGGDLLGENLTVNIVTNPKKRWTYITWILTDVIKEEKNHSKMALSDLGAILLSV